jgi:hypothetical protein
MEQNIEEEAEQLGTGPRGVNRRREDSSNMKEQAG